MNAMKKPFRYLLTLSVATPMLLLIFGAGSDLLAGDNNIAYTSMYTDLKARKVGDIVTVEIIEFSNAESRARTQTDMEDQSSFSNQATGDFDFLPLFNIGTSVSNEYDGQGRTSRQGSLRAKITATIIAVDSAGNLVIEGTRSVNINGERQLTTLRGTVRPQDVTADNIVYSYNISNAQITYSGKGMIQDAHKPGILTRIINWIF
jgi:flagellar L-ring protein precursor FlgH